MSTPMFDVPDHTPIGVDCFGNGPVSEDDPDFCRTVCWCGLTWPCTEEVE